MRLRTVLAATGLALAIQCLPAAAATIPLLNADFETGPNGNQPGQANGLRFNQLMTTNPGWDTYSSLSGWTRGGGGGRIEIHSDRSAALDAHSGDHFITLDSGRNLSISQDVTLAVGSYVLSFWYSPQSLSASTNEIAYNLGNVVSGRVSTGTNGATVGVWTEIRQRIGIVTAGNYRLSFASTGAADGVGGYIDNVALTTAVPVPAAGIGLLGALAALVALRRRVQPAAA